MSELETHVGTRGEAPEEVGFRNQLRARWRALPQERRWAITIVLELAIAFALWGLALSLTYAALFIFTILAVGLNMVVGYAGLLDLGYVAFYATGAYTAAWFASLQFSHVPLHFGAVGLNPADLPGIHITIWLLLPAAGVFTAICGILI